MGKIQNLSNIYVKIFILGFFIGVLALGYSYFSPPPVSNKVHFVQGPSPLGKATASRMPSSVSDTNQNSAYSQCQEDSSNSCFTVIKCQVSGGTTTSYIDPVTQTTFAITSSSVNFKNPGQLLGDYETEFHQARARQVMRRTRSPASKLSQKHRQSFRATNISAHISKFGRRANAHYVLNSGVPACVKPGDIQ